MLKTVIILCAGLLVAAFSMSGKLNYFDKSKKSEVELKANHSGTFCLSDELLNRPDFSFIEVVRAVENNKTYSLKIGVVLENLFPMSIAREKEFKVIHNDKDDVFYDVLITIGDTEKEIKRKIVTAFALAMLSMFLFGLAGVFDAHIKTSLKFWTVLLAWIPVAYFYKSWFAIVVFLILGLVVFRVIKGNSKMIKPNIVKVCSPFFYVSIAMFLLLYIYFGIAFEITALVKAVVFQFGIFLIYISAYNYISGIYAEQFKRALVGRKA